MFCSVHGSSTTAREGIRNNFLGLGRGGGRGYLYCRIPVQRGVTAISNIVMELYMLHVAHLLSPAQPETLRSIAFHYTSTIIGALGCVAHSRVAIVFRLSFSRFTGPHQHPPDHHNTPLFTVRLRLPKVCSEHCLGESKYAYYAVQYGRE